tara:strand:- start:268 stop:420 length:153 start_codon:yes stop_codon:yes gene_type:complete
MIARTSVDTDARYSYRKDFLPNGVAWIFHSTAKCVIYARNINTQTRANTT